MTWITKLKIEDSIKEIQKDEISGKDFCLDPLRFEDLSLKDVREELINEVKKRIEKSYSIANLICIDVPKSNYTLRPAARPNLIDWIIYNAIVNLIGSKIYKKIPKNSFSFNRFRDKQEKKKKFSSVGYWIEFEDESVSLSKDSRYSYLLTTDITSFFENISIETLGERLKILSNDSNYIAAVNFLINNILSKWAETNKIKNFGLPQGPTASTILADVYLYSVDREISKNKIKFLRYMDDIRIFTRDKAELKRNIIILVRLLRELKLNLNAKKTIIYKTSNKKKLENVFDPESSRLSLIDEAFRSTEKNQILLVAPSLIELKELSKNTEGNFSERYLKFFISHVIDLMRFGLIKKDYVKKLTNDFLDLFEEKHHLSNVLSWFFIAAGQYSKELQKIIQSRLIEFICNKNKNIYEWQKMWTLDTIRQLGKISKKDLKKIKKSYFKNSELCFSQYILLAGMSGDFNDREEILNICKCENDLYRPTFLATQELNRDVIRKSNIYSPVYFHKYIENLKGEKYGYSYTLKRNDLSIEYNPSGY